MCPKKWNKGLTAAWFPSQVGFNNVKKKMWLKCISHRCLGLIKGTSLLERVGNKPPHCWSECEQSGKKAVVAMATSQARFPPATTKKRGARSDGRRGSRTSVLKSSRLRRFQLSHQPASLNEKLGGGLGEVQMPVVEGFYVWLFRSKKEKCLNSEFEMMLQLKENCEEKK